MITAEEARKISQEKLVDQIAVELTAYMTKCVEPAIKKASDRGIFETIVGFRDIAHCDLIAPEAVKALKLAGFEAKHVYNCDQHDYENHIYINWYKKV